jgi:membrane dipeptidase
VTRSALLLALSLGCASVARAPSSAELAARAEELAQELIILDGHIDLPYRLTRKMEDVSVRTEEGDFDHPRAMAGGLDAPFMSIFVPAEYEEKGGAKSFADELIDLVESLARDYPDKFALAASASDVRSAAAQGRIALLLGMENGSPIEGRLENLDHFHGRGVRYITLCHGKDNHICDSSYDERKSSGGLTPFGRSVVQRMNELGIMVDVSHISDQSFWDVLEVSRAPVIASHSSLRHFTPGFERNLADDMVKALAEKGGVVQINFGSSFISEDYRQYDLERRERLREFLAESGLERSDPGVAEFTADYQRAHPQPFADVSDVADHIDRVVDLAGIDHVGFGSDFDGVGDSLPTGLKDVSQFPNLIAELLRRGYGREELEKICSGNVLRVMEEVERLATR